jgi:hypothetical protein
VVSVDFTSSLSSCAPVTGPISSEARLLFPVLEPSSSEKRTFVRPSSEDLGCPVGALPREVLALKSSCRKSPESRLLVPCAALESTFWAPGSRELCPPSVPAVGDGDVEPVIACVPQFLLLQYCLDNLSCFSCLSSSHRVQSNHTTVVAATRNTAWCFSDRRPRFRCLVFSSSQVLETVDFVRCDKHILGVCVRADRNRCVSLDKQRTKDWHGSGRASYTTNIGCA